MNFRTTWILAAVFIGLGLGYYLWRPGSRVEESAVDQTRPPGTSPVSRDLLDEKLGELVKVVCKTKGGEEWVFKKDAESEVSTRAVWRMTSPLTMKVISWELQRFGRQFNGLQYDISYKPGEPGAVTAAQAGLEPPEATVTLTDADGKTATVEIGKQASTSETFVRLAGTDEICVGKANLKNLIKSKALDYRDQQLWTFDAKNVTRLEIDDRSDADKPVTYVLAKRGGQWIIESPVTAKATSKVDDVLRTISNLRAVKWHDHRPDRLAMYGLEPASLTVRATVEEEVEVEEEEERAESTQGEEETGEGEPEAESEEQTAEPETQVKVTTYELHVSQRSPIGEETKVYIRPGGEPVVGTLMKTVADKFRPVMSEWREMRLTTENVQAATRVELATPGGETTLVKTQRRWSFESDGGRADDAVVRELLSAIVDLKAVVFVESNGKDLSSFGLDAPQAEIRLTIPGLEEIERITVGGYTDAEVKRLVHVRRNEVGSIAKVRAADVEALKRGPLSYRDRTVIDLSPGRIERIEMCVENRFANGRTDVTFERQEEQWNMVAPVAAALEKDRVAKMIDAVAGLRAESIVADEGELTAYGLHAPAATLTLTYNRIEKPTDQSATEVQPPPETVTLSVTQHDGKVYGKRLDRSAVYELTREFYDRLFDEYRTDEVLTFDDAAVKRLTIRFGRETHVFERRDDGWIYQPEPDLPLSTKKVDNLLLQVNDLRTTRYVSYAAEGLDAFGLSTPYHEVTVELADGTTRILRVSTQVCQRDPDKGLYAVVEGKTGVFLLTSETVKRFEVSIGELEAE